MYVEHSELLRLLNYDPNSGIFTWSKDSHIKMRNKIAGGYEEKVKYIRIKVKGKLYLAHRLAWFYVTGEWPKHEIDHIDGNKLNNSIENLRDIPRGINRQNMRFSYKNNKSGLLGVSKARWGKKKWIARLYVGGVEVYRENFLSKEEASAAYLEAKRKLHKGCVI